MTVGLLVNKLAIKNNSGIKTVSDIVPDCWIYVQDRDVKLGRVQIFNNWSPYMLADYKNTVFIGLEYFCSEGDQLWAMQDSDFIEMAIDEISKIGMIQKESVLKSTLVRQKNRITSYNVCYTKLLREANDFLCNVLQSKLGINKSKVYVIYFDQSEWGYKGSYIS